MSVFPSDDNDAEMGDDAQNEEDKDESSDDEDSRAISEIRFVPSDKAACEVCEHFVAICPSM